jgi:hypothetical protein
VFVCRPSSLRCGHAQQVRGQPREGSRFVGWQLYGMAASGSRKLLGMWNLHMTVGRYDDRGLNADRTNTSWVTSGTHLLLIYRIAMLRSGLPDIASRSFKRRGEVWLDSEWAFAVPGVECVMRPHHSNRGRVFDDRGHSLKKYSTNPPPWGWCCSAASSEPPDAPHSLALGKGLGDGSTLGSSGKCLR